MSTVDDIKTQYHKDLNQRIYGSHGASTGEWPVRLGWAVNVP